MHFPYRRRFVVGGFLAALAGLTVFAGACGDSGGDGDVPLSANTLASSVGRVIDLFEPIVRHIAEACLTSSFTALDATRMPVLDPAHPLGIRSGALWLIEGDHRYSYFLYAPTGHASHIDDRLSGRTLASVMCDGSPRRLACSPPNAS